jgi:hypothetical protein
MPYGRLLDENAHCCEALLDLSYPVVPLQGRKSGGDRFVECLRSDLNGVLNVANISYGYCASPENHRPSLALSLFVRHDDVLTRPGSCVAWILRPHVCRRWNRRFLPIVQHKHQLRGGPSEGRTEISKDSK